MNNCEHTHRVWKGQIQFCLECSKQTGFKDMLEVVILPNGDGGERCTKDQL